MKTALAAALGAALLFATGCSLTIDPEGVEPPKEQQPPPPVRGACVGEGAAHRLCGGNVSSGAGSVASSGHAVGQSILAGGDQPTIESSQHRILRGAVSP